ncbi:MAG TPA: LysM peptidoglycan-binding domain-containing protein [Pseudonocardiaceae bacterium]|nr:LysM peptidoglycan-binding domain-containing protein [Pseudonocardiaceae bacterium]
MAILSNVRGSLPARSAAAVRPAQPVAPPPVRRRGVSHADGRRPARLVASPARAVAQPCGPRPMTGSIGWLVLVAVLGFLLVLGIGWTMGGQPASTVPDRTVLVQVHQGESLWTVAQRMSPGAPADAVVAKIRQLNDLTADSVLFPGELLRVPSTLTAPQAGTVQR